MNLKCVLLLFILTAIPMFCGSSQAAKSSTLPVIVPDDVQSEPLEDEEIPRTQKSTYPYVEVHGDYRWLWGKGRFSAYSEQPGKAAAVMTKRYIWPRADCGFFLSSI